MLAKHHIVNYQALHKSAIIARLAYKTMEELHVYKGPALALAENLVQVASIDKTFEDAQATLWTTGKTVHLAFRGTCTPIGEMNDLDIRTKTVYDDVEVHAGFYNQYLSIKPQILTYLSEHSTFDNVRVAGHSLGGALAMIASANLGEMFPTTYISCHTFGCPRTGNAGFARWFQKNVDESYRVTNKQDPIPMIPQSHRWTHAMNHTLVIDDDCHVWFPTEDIPWYERVFTSMKCVDFHHPVKDHDCDVYISRLHKLEETRPNSPKLPKTRQ